MPQLLVKETDPVGQVLRVNLGECYFQRHLIRLKCNPRDIVIPGAMRQNLPGPLDLPRDLEIRLQVVDGVPCKPLMDAWKKEAVNYFRRHSLSFSGVKLWLMKQPGAELIQAVKQLECNIRHLYTFIKRQHVFQHTRVILLNEFPNIEPSTEQAMEFITKHKVKGYFRTPTSLQYFYRVGEGDTGNLPLASVNRKASKEMALELQEGKDAA